MTNEEFNKRFNDAMSKVYDLLVESGAPDDAWIDEFDIFAETIPDAVAEYLGSVEYAEGTGRRPRFKCMEGSRSRPIWRKVK